jgi:WXXGXW repeat (2 copies)
MLTLRRLVPLSIASCLALATPLTGLPSAAFAQALAVSITVAPPPLPVYAQPIIPGPGYMWVPGYWAWGPYGYYWVPGTWLLPPAVGLLWTPGYWAWMDGAYIWYAGYWGPHVGFYGGINYGFGYTGVGYFGGRWDHGVFFYNRAVNNISNMHFANVYSDPVVNRNTTRASFNGGRGGTNARPTAEEQAAARERHLDATSLQAQHEHAAAGNHALRASVNHGRPRGAATAKPASFTGRGVVGARGARHAGRPAHAPVHAAAARHPGPQHGQAWHGGLQHNAPHGHPGQQHAARQGGGHEHGHP